MTDLRIALDVMRVQRYFEEWEWRCTPTTMTKDLDRQSFCSAFGVKGDLSLFMKEIAGTDPRQRPSFGDAVFDPEPFAKGSFRKAFKGHILLGVGDPGQPAQDGEWGGWQWNVLGRSFDPYKGVFVNTGQGRVGGNASAVCVVKKFNKNPSGGVTQNSVADLRALHMAADFADKFNKSRNPPHRIRFVKCKLYQDRMTSEDVDMLEQLVMKDPEENGSQRQEALDHLTHIRKFRTDNVYLVEPALSSFIKRNSNSGWVKDTGVVYDVAHAVAQAFSHWTWTESHGACLVCDLQGTHDLLLTDPVIHTAAGRSTLTDLGELGMCAFFKTHVCTPLCNDLKRPDITFLSKYADLLPPVERTTYWYETVAISAEVHAQQGTTCFAYAAATVMRAAIASQKEAWKVPKHNDIVTDIVFKYGINGAFLDDVLLEFCARYDLCVSEVDPAEAKELVRRGSAVAISFHLTNNQWTALEAFYEQSPTAVLIELPRPRGKRVGHAAVVTRIFGSTWELKNSWGEDFADQGKFKIGIDVIGPQAKYYSVFCKLESKDQDEEGTTMSAIGGYLGFEGVPRHAIQAGPDRTPEAIPIGMALVEMHGKFERDSCQEIVSYLYSYVGDGTYRSTHINAIKGHAVHVPEDDIQSLADAYSSEEFQQHRRGFEEDAKAYNKEEAFAMRHGKKKGSRCARLRFFKRNGDEVFPRTRNQPGSSHDFATNAIDPIEDETISNLNDV